MASDPYARLAADLERLISAASTEYQRCQLAAQQADIEGLDLAAAVLRSIAEGHSGKAQGLMQYLRTLRSGSAEMRGATERNLVEALERNSAMTDLSASISAEALTALDSRSRDDLDALIKLTDTNRSRLQALLKSVAAVRAEPVRT